MPVKKSNAAAKARRADRRYLVDIVQEGRVVGWRFAPGPHMRARGMRTRILRRDDGHFMNFEEARAFRDRELARASGANVAEPAPAPIPPGRRTLNAAWAAWQDWQARLAEGDDDRVAPRTFKFYAWAIGPWLAWGGDAPVKAFDAEIIIEEYQVQRSERSHSSAHASLRALQAVLAFARRKGWIAHNPALGLRRSQPAGRQRLASPAEVEALVAAADASGRAVIGDAIIAALWTGQRQGDLLDCDLGRQLIDGRLVFHQGKTGARAQSRLAAPLAQRLRGRSAGLLLPGPGGGRWNEHTFRHEFARVRAKAAEACPSVADLQFRDLRDTAITRLALAGVDKIGRRATSGHSPSSQEQMEHDHYLVLTAEFADEAADRLDAWRLRTGVKW